MSKKKEIKMPYHYATIIAVLAFVAASGGTFGGYYVGKSDAGHSSAAIGEVLRVERVIDGDTVVLNTGEKVRLLGINAPETSECYADEARLGLWQIVAGQKVELRKDIEERDSYDRLLRHVVVVKDGEDNVHVNAEMLERGLAVEQNIAPNKMYESVLEKAEERARVARVGMWGACVVEESESAQLREIGNDPPTPEHVIKGNISEKGYGKNYFMPGCPNYHVVKVDVRKGESWFVTESEAKKAGFTKSESCGNVF